MDERTVNDVAANAMSRPSVYVPALVDEITRLRAELAECKRDAERFRWLKKVGNYDSAYQYAIDAARKGEETQ